MSELERIHAVRDLTGSLSVFLDEFAACWGGLHIANDELRSALMLALTEETASRARLADWIESRLDGEHAHLVAPLVSLLWSSGGTTAGTRHAFEVTLDEAPPIGVARLAEVLRRAFDAHHADAVGHAPDPRRHPLELLAGMAASAHLFGLPGETEDALEQATGALWDVALRGDPPGAADGNGEPLKTVAATRGWRRTAIFAQADLVALPGLEVRQYSLVPFLARHTVTLLRLADGISEPSEIGVRLGPAPVAAWYSFGHALGDCTLEPDGEEVEPLPVEDDPFRELADYAYFAGSEASRLLAEGAWFDGLLTADGFTPCLSGGVRALLAHRGELTPERGEHHVEVVLDEARALLTRLSSNLGSGQAAVPAFQAKVQALRASGGSSSDLGSAEYVLRVVEGITAVADEAAEFADHLDAAVEGDFVGDLDLGLRLAAIVAWIDATARWVVSDAVLPTDAETRRASPPSGRREPARLLRDLEGSLPEDYSLDEYRLVLDQRSDQWDEIAVLDDLGAPDFTEDLSDVVEIEGFANR